MPSRTGSFSVSLGAAAERAVRTPVPDESGSGMGRSSEAGVACVTCGSQPRFMSRLNPCPGLRVRSTVMTVASQVVLEPAAQQVADAFSKPPFLYDMTPADARSVLNDAQSAPVSKPSVDEEWIAVPSPAGEVRVRIVKPQGATGTLPVIVYMHGGGWILGNAGTHDRLVRELAVGAGAALAFVEYPNSPDAHYPTAIEQGYAAAQRITRNGASMGLDASRMAVAGESVGGNMTAALALMAKDRGDVTFAQQSMYYPVTDASMNTASYDKFATGY